MGNIENYSDLSKLYAAQKKLDAYNNYQTLIKKGEKIDDALFAEADFNGDGKVTSADKTAINKEISALKNSKTTPNLFDVTGDGKIGLADLIEISGGLDLDADGEISEDEMKFLETQATTLMGKLNVKSTTTQDINGDGKVDINDLQEFMDMTADRASWDSDDKIDTFLKSVQNQINYKLANFASGGSRIDIQDLAAAEQLLIAAQTAVDGEGTYDNLSDKEILKADLDGNKSIDENDVKNLELVIKSLKKQLGVEDGELETIQANYETTLGTVNSLTAQKTTEAAEIKTLKSQVSKLETTLNSATKAYNTAVSTLEKNTKNYESNLAKLEQLQAEYEKVEKYDSTKYKSRFNREYKYYNKAQNLKSQIAELEKAVDLAAQQEDIETKQAAKDEATANLAATKEEYDAVQQSYAQTTSDLAAAKTEYTAALKEYNSVKTYFTKTTQVQTNYNKDIAKTALSQTSTRIEAANANLTSNDEVLNAALAELTDEEKVLINELGIDITETFADGSPKYVLAKGSKDNKYHIYQYDEPNGTSAKSLIRRYAPNEGYSIIKKGDGILCTTGNTWYENPTSDSSIIIPKKVETTPENELYEIIDSLTKIYTSLYEENYQAAQKPDSELLKNAQKEAVTLYANNQISKEQIASTIVSKMAESGVDASKILDSISSNDHFGQSITSLTNKLCTLIDSTKTTTELGHEEGTNNYNTSSPLSFDLNGDGVKTSQNKIEFDIDGDGKLDIINDSADAVLVFDSDGNGIAGENGKEVFGDNTDLDGDGVKDGFANGFEALKALAYKEGLINGTTDNTLDENDIKILQEKYSLGLKTSGYNSNVTSLTSAGISEINFGSSSETKSINNFDGNNNILMTQQGSTFKVNGLLRSYADIWHVLYHTEDEDEEV